ncbi:MAG: hypothetical protein GDYSWBUE_001256 [Candidatus Fervidibacterota bacterium]
MIQHAIRQSVGIKYYSIAKLDVGVNWYEPRFITTYDGISCSKAAQP